jgi:hypothetical protein
MRQVGLFSEKKTKLGKKYCPMPLDSLPRNRSPLQFSTLGQADFPFGKTP